MPKLKLFVSHSSRLDDIDHEHADDDRNWRLLGETCKAIRDRYGDRVEVLVDQDGLIPGDLWGRCLYIWLAECHIAIILFSKRAITKSNWVAKEAAILSWRRELDPNFILIPVLLDGETTPKDLREDFFGTLKIDESQCIPNAATASNILAGLIRKLGKPEELAGSYPQTPLEMLQGGIAELLSDETTTASLQAALQAIDADAVLADDPEEKKRYAIALARKLFDDTYNCFDNFQRGLNPLTPSPLRERAEALFRYIRSLWVNAGAAACMPAARGHQKPLALSGQMLAYSDTILGTKCYTLERYIERGWPNSVLFRIVRIDSTTNINGVRDEIRRSIWGPMIPPGIPEDMLDQRVNQDPNVIILFITDSGRTSGLPDQRLLHSLSHLHNAYQDLVIVLDVGTDMPALPDTIGAVEPRLELGCEYMAFGAERSARTFLDQIYGISR